MHPLLDVFEPVVASDPEVGVGSELLDHAADLVVVGCLHFEQVLPGVELSGLLLEGGQAFVDLDAAFADVFVFVDVLVGMEVKDGSLKIVNRLFELLLVELHLLQKFALLLLQLLVSFLH